MKRNYRCKEFFRGVAIFLFTLFSYNIQAQTPNSPREFLPIKQNRLWGAIDFEGNVMIPPHYTYLASLSSSNLAIARKEKHLGLIDLEGNTILPFKYRNIRPLGDSLLALLAETWQIFRLGENQFLPGAYDNIQLYVNPDTTFGKAQLIRVWKDGKQGFLDFSGSYLIAPQYEYLEPLTADLYKVYQNGRLGILHGTLGLQLEAIYEDIRYDNQFFFLVRDSLLGLAGPDGKKVLPAQFDQILSFGDSQEERLWMVRKDQSWGLVDMQGDTLIPLEYDSLLYLAPGFSAVNQNGKQGIYAWQKGLSIGCEHEQISPLDSNYALIQSGERFGLFGYRQKKQVLPTRYKEIEAFHTPQWPRDHFLVRDGDRLGVLDEDNRYRIPLGRYDFITFDPAGLFRIRSGSKWGISSETGSIAPQFDYISAFQKQIALVSHSGLYGLINRYGEILAPLQYQNIEIRAFRAKLYLSGGAVDVLELNAQGRAVDRYTLQQLKKIKLVKGKTPKTDPEEPAWDFTAPPNQANLNTRPGPFGSSGANPPLPQGNDWQIAPGPDISVGAFTWYCDSLTQKWGLKNAQDSVLIAPEYEGIRVAPDLPMTSVWKYRRSSGQYNLDRALRLYGLVNHELGRFIIRPFYGADIAQALSDFSRGELAKQSRFYVFKDGSRIAQLPQAQLRGLEVLKRIFFAENFQNYNLSRCNVGGYPANLRTRRIELKTDIRGGKWGLVNRQGNIVVNAIYDDMTVYDQRGLAWIQKNKKVGVLDTTGQELVPPAYKLVDYMNYADPKTGFLLTLEKPRWGFIDSSGQVCVSLDYIEVKPFSEGKAAVRFPNKRWGFVRDNNQLLDTLQFRDVRGFSEGRAAVKENYHWGFLDEAGQPIGKHHYERVGDFHEGKAWVRKNRKYGYIDLDGETLIPCQYGKVSDFEGGRAVAYDLKKRAFGLIDSRGRWLAPPRYREIGPLRKDGFRVFRKHNHATKLGLMDQSGKEVLPNHYLKISFFDTLGHAWVKKSFRESYFVNKSGQRLFEGGIQQAWPFKEGLAAVKFKDQWGYMDESGQWIISPQYEKAHSFYKGIAQVEMNSQTYYIDRQGKILKQHADSLAWVNVNQIDTLRPFYEGIAAYQKEGKWGLIDQKGKVFLYPRYEAVSGFYQGYARISHQGKDRFVNHRKKFQDSFVGYQTEWVDRQYPYLKLMYKNGKIGLESEEGFMLVPPRFNRVKSFREGKAPVMVENLMGISGPQGNILLPVNYEIIQAVGKGVYRIEQNNKLGYWHIDKGWIWPIP